MSLDFNKITQKYAEINDAIKSAVQEFRPEKPVRLVIVTKYVEADVISHLLNLGHRAFAENRMQNAYKKWENIKINYTDLELHYIGRLQSSKINQVITLFDTIESVDSISLLKKLHEKISGQKEKRKFYIQVNVGEEEQKNGVLPSNLSSLIQEAKTHGLSVDGLMCIPPYNTKPFLYFAFMNKLAKKFNIKELSMGMSNDFITAIKFGATEVRIGRAIFDLN